MKFKLLLFLLVFALASFSWGQTCHITSDSTPPAVNGGATHNFTTDCTSATWSVSGAGSVNSSGVYTAPATIWARDVSRGWQVLPDNSVYKLPINTLPVDNRSSYWMQRDPCPAEKGISEAAQAAAGRRQERPVRPQEKGGGAAGKDQGTEKEDQGQAGRAEAEA